MPVTKDECVNASHRQELHKDHAPGGKVYTWRVNGVCKTWKTRPTEFRLPVKYGLYDYGYVTELNADQFHWAKDCPDA